MKIYYISLQRCGTKSFSEFFNRNGYKVASWKTSAKNRWPEYSWQGRYQKIMASGDYKEAQVFEDGPWFHIPLVRYLYWAEPASRFVFFRRPFEDWMKSMKNHSNGNTPGRPKYHCMMYGRLGDYYSLVNDGIEPRLKLAGSEDYYARTFRDHDLLLRAFFEDKPQDRFFQADLNDPNKYRKLSRAWSIEFEYDADVHIHKSGHPKEVDFARALGD